MAKIHKMNRENYIFHCPGCKDKHMIKVSSSGWTFNEDFDKPSIIPSILVTSRGFRPKCHSFVTDGKIKFLNDSEHELAGKTVDLEDF